jgi:uncharacterized NAD(P)/FAD-binding protein YdhS
MRRPDVSPDSVPTVAIVGAGFSGTMTAVQLARQSAGRPLRVVLIEPSGRFGTGVAYGTRCTKHVLNVPAGNMSALPDKPTDFIEWTRRHGINDSPDAFVPRYWYGVYLHDLLEEARSHAWIDRVGARVVDIAPNPGGNDARVLFEKGEPLRADRVVLAGGNFPPSEGPLAGTGFTTLPRYIRDPWRPKALEQIQPAHSVMLIGSGLTMIDVVVQLRSSGHCGTIHALSRRGLLPQPHRPPNQHVPLPVPPEVMNAPRTARGLLRGVRQAVRRERKAGHDWRDVISSLRPVTIDLWTSLPLTEKERFLRHVRPFWDTHRHRIPVDVAEEFSRQRADGKFVLYRARIAGSNAEADHSIQVRLQPRDGSAELIVSVQWVINCTGPDSDIRRVDGSMWAKLLERDLVQPDPLGLGVVTTSDGALVNSRGEASAWLNLLGPLRKAQLWESTAVPELRVQAEKLAKKLLAELADKSIPSAWHDADAPDLLAGEDADPNAVPVYIGEYI